MPRVPPDGPCPCDLAVVGESPGKQEVAEGRGFVGRSGKVLWGGDDLIGSVVGRPRETVWVTNVCKHPLPEDEWVHLSHNQKAKYVDELRRELDMVEAKVVITFGARAGSVLIPGFSTMTNESGKHRVVGKKIIVPCFHPAAMLRGNPKVLEKLIEALLPVPDLLNDYDAIINASMTAKQLGLYDEPVHEFPDWPQSIGGMKLEDKKGKKCVLCGETKGEIGRYRSDKLKWQLCATHAVAAELWALRNEEAMAEHSLINEKRERLHNLERSADRLQNAIKESLERMQ